MWGIDMEYIKTRFGTEINNHCLLNAQEYINNYYLEQTNNNIILTDEGKLIADKICSDLFIVR